MVRAPKPNFKEYNMTQETPELTVEQKMATAIAKAKEARKKVKDEARLALLTNGNYVDYMASIDEEAEQITKLIAMTDALNGMKKIVVADGTSYGVNIYPVAEYIFGPVMSRVLGIITGSSAMFTDERQLEFFAITHVPHLMTSKARDAIGSPAYYSKGVLANAIPGNGDSVETAVTAVCEALGVDLSYAKKVNASTIERWFKVAQDKAVKQYEEFRKVEVVDSANSFVLKD